MKLLIATQNKGKQAEFRALLGEFQLPLTPLTPDEVGLGAFDVEETGDTLPANAALKALAFAGASGLHALADDSGLMVDALDGAPGVYSARYGGPGLDAAGRRRRLLDALRDVPEAARTARFECVIALANPATQTQVYEVGVCPGRIALAESAGRGGFGYDPVFIPDGYTQTFADLDESIKNRISHRGRALTAMLPHLTALIALAGST